MNIINNLPIGAKVADKDCPETIFRVAGRDLPGYPGIVLVADRIIKQGCFDAQEPKNPNHSRASYGNNHYPTSNAHQWLNSNKADWFVPAHEHDAPPIADNIYDGDNPYALEPGFLARFSETFLNALREAAIKTRDEITQAKVWLMSASEVGLDKDGAEGPMFPLFEDFRMKVAAPSPEAVETASWKPSGFNATEGWPYWLRSPYAAYSYFVRLVLSDGSETYNYAYLGHLGLRPALLLSSEISVSDSPDERGVYIIA